MSISGFFSAAVSGSIGIGLVCLAASTRIGTEKEPSPRSLVRAEHGAPLECVASGLLVPLQMQCDAAGNLFVGSGFPGVGKYPVVRLDRTAEHAPDCRHARTLASLPDPDAIALGPDQRLYVGAHSGRIFAVDPVDGTTETWLEHHALGNLDGLAWFRGDLYAVAIDREQVWRIDGASRAVSVFADLGRFGMRGMTGIAFHPERPRVYLGSPNHNRIVETDLEGRVLREELASGFEYLGHFAFDPTGAHPDTLFVADNGAGELIEINLRNGYRTCRIRGLCPHIGGLAFDTGGALYFSVTDNEGRIGEIWKQEADAPVPIEDSSAPTRT